MAAPQGNGCQAFLALPLLEEGQGVFFPSHPIPQHHVVNQGPPAEDFATVPSLTPPPATIECSSPRWHLSGLLLPDPD